MGVEQSIWVRMTCPKCGATETVTASDYGSAMRGTRWRALSTAVRFAVTTTRDPTDYEPGVDSASCNECLLPASLEKGWGDAPRA